MGTQIGAVRGTQDLLPSKSYRWKFVEQIMIREALVYGFKEIRTPTMEYTPLFNHSAGQLSDVVQKEMYTFCDRAGRSLTLRPEGTAGVVRSLLEHSLHQLGLPLKMYYLGPFFRYEKPQAGRFREFHQFGVEVFGSADPSADVELMALAWSMFMRLQIKDVELHINSIGCRECRTSYYEELKRYFQLHKNALCKTCIDRMDRNPMRILDCKNPICHEIVKGAPVVLDYLCENCADHFQKVQHYLQVSKLPFSVDCRIVRGLDYYSGTVFEFVSNGTEAQGTVCGGGRYDTLIEELGGKHIPALGFGIGMERLIAVMEKQGAHFPNPERCVLYVATVDERARETGFRLIRDVRDCGMIAESDLMRRGLKAQLKYADKIGAFFSLVLGEEEIETKTAKLRCMSTGKEYPVSLNTGFVRELVLLYEGLTKEVLEKEFYSKRSDEPKR